MTKKNEDGAREQVSACLPEAVGYAIRCYQTFLENDAPDDPKEFRIFQDACRAAINHLHELIKLSEWADIDCTVDENAEQREAVAVMMQRAVEELKSHQSKDV